MFWGEHSCPVCTQERFSKSINPLSMEPSRHIPQPSLTQPSVLLLHSSHFTALSTRRGGLVRLDKMRRVVAVLWRLVNFGLFVRFWFVLLGTGIIVFFSTAFVLQAGIGSRRTAEQLLQDNRYKSTCEQLKKCTVHLPQ
jgi:hypothetical protein